MTKLNSSDQEVSDEAQDRCLSGTTLHLTPDGVWSAAHGAAEYTPEAFGVEGFIHCTNGEALVLEAGNRYYRDDPRPYVLLDIDLSRVASRAVYEDSARHFPHVYGPIERAAVIRVRRVNRAADGTFLSIDHDPTHTADR